MMTSARARTVVLFAVPMLLLGFGRRAGAQAIGYDSYSYSVGPLAGNNGGTGWAGAWSAANINVVAGGLSHPTGGLVVAGGATQLNISTMLGTTNSSRTLATSLGSTGTVVWFSFLLKPNQTSAFDYDGLNLGTAGSQLFVGYQGTNFVLNRSGGGGSSQSIAFSTIPFSVGQTAFIAVRVAFTAGVDTATFYINPTAGLSSPDSPPAHTGTKSDLDVGTFISVAIAGGRGFTANTANLDELRIGNTFIDVAPTTGISAVAVDTTNDVVDGDTTSVAALSASKGTDGRISLREAIIACNNTVGLDTVKFAIDSGVQTISPNTALPTIIDAVVIDGTSQPGYANKPIIVLNGGSAGAGVDGLSLDAGSDGSTIRGLVVNNFGGDGIAITSSDNVVRGNFIGTDSSGTLDSGNAFVGILLDGVNAHNNTIGGTTEAERNVISGNNAEGVRIDSGAHDNVVSGNYIGVDVSGTSPVANSTEGIGIMDAGTDHNTIGGTAAGAGNIVAFNGGRGMRIADGVGNSLLGNSIFSNGSLGIDLNADGVTTNDSADVDTGPNNLQNFPVLDSAFTNGVNAVVVFGSLNSTATDSFRVQLFASGSADGTGFGEGETYLGDTTVATNGSGDVNFIVMLAAAATAGEVVSATATDTAGNTSEFSDTVLAVLGGVVVSVSVSNSTFAFGVSPANQWLPADSSLVINDGTVAENFAGQISTFTDGSNTWAVSDATNGADSIRAQWSTTGATGPWNDIAAYDSDFTIATDVAVSDTVTLWFRIQTPVSTTSFNEHASTLTVTAEAF